MTSIARLPPPVSKEFRALALPWLACLACMVAPALADAPRWLGGLSAPAYFLGAAALGALSIGHEYSDRTLSLMLTLPARRERLFAIKLGVLSIMLFALWVVAYTLVFGDSRLPQASKDMAALLPLLCGLFLAPWLTMLCRNPIGGAVFALGIPGIVLVAGELIGLRVYGHGSVAEAFRLTFVSFGTIGLCAIGAVLGWRTFIRLEAIEGLGQDVRLPQWLRVSNATGSVVSHITKRNPNWLLVNKEIRLQHLPLVLSGFYVLGWLATAWLTTFVSESAYSDRFAALTLPYALLLPMLIGSCASASERQIGTLEWQVLLPMAAWKQWAVKVGVVLGLSVALTLALPIVLLDRTLTVPKYAIVIVFVLAAGSLYVSSLCRNSLRALVISIPAMFAGMLFLQAAIEWIGIPTHRWAHSMTPRGGSRSAGPMLMDVDGLTQLLIGVFIGVVVRFAYANHRSADSPARRVCTQVIVMAVFVAAGVFTRAAWFALRR